MKVKKDKKPKVSVKNTAEKSNSPLESFTPNKKTIAQIDKALKELSSGKLKIFKNVDELMADLLS